MSFALEPRKTRTTHDEIDRWFESLRAPCLSRIAPVEDFNQSTDARTTAIEKRRREFSLGRRCAESLLKQFGNRDQVWTNEDRSPAWPNGFSGSISHSQSWTWAAVGLVSKVTSIGIDTEKIVDAKTREQIVFEIATPREWEICESVQATPEQMFSIVFSAKEAFYKCCYPLTKQYFGFEHAAIEAASENQLQIKTLPSHPCIETMPSSLTVYYMANESDVFTITWMERA